jgi:hypothetical protein
MQISFASPKKPSFVTRLLTKTATKEKLDSRGKTVKLLP